MSKHTPGPWVVSSSFLVCRKENAAVVAQCTPLGLAELDVSIPESIANARLIAAAPELYEAAAEVLSHREGDLPRQGWLKDNDASRAALAKLAAALAKVTP